jgi:hypothetical protein
MQGRLRIRLVVCERLSFDARSRVMKLVDLEGYRTPAGSEALRRSPQRLGDLAERTGPVRPPRRRQLQALFDRCDRLGERGFEKSFVVHWDHPPCCPGMDWDGHSCILQYFMIMSVVNKGRLHHDNFIIIVYICILKYPFVDSDSCLFWLLLPLLLARRQALMRFHPLQQRHLAVPNSASSEELLALAFGSG